MKRYIIPILGIISITLLVSFWFLEKRVDQEATATPTPERQAACERFLTVALFPDDGSAETFMEECLRGEPVLPEEQDDSLYEEGGVVTPPITESPTTGTYVGAGCAVGGCSSQVCGEAGEAESVVTTCEWREDYACYRASRCEKQASGKCGWTETEEFKQCLTDARNTSSAGGNVIY